MARNKGNFIFAANFQVKMQEALDPRVVVSAKADLINKETWPYDGDTIYLYNGLIVGVAEEKSAYMLVDITKVTESDYSGWVRIDAGAAVQVEVVDNLESDASDKALSAKQGKVLMNEINTVIGKLAGVYTYRGSKATFAELPEEGLVAGDVWNVEEKVGEHAAGTNWAWTGEAWDALAGTIDLSSYYNKSEVEALVNVEKERAKAAEAALSLRIETNATGISEAKSAAAVNLGKIDSITKTIGEINTLNTAQSERLVLLENAVFGEAGEGGEQLSIVDIVNQNSQNITLLQEKDEELAGLISTLSGKVDVLNGDANVEGSVDNKINAAFNWIDVEAPEVEE